MREDSITLKDHLDDLMGRAATMPNVVTTAASRVRRLPNLDGAQAVFMAQAGKNACADSADLQDTWTDLFFSCHPADTAALGSVRWQTPHRATENGFSSHKTFQRRSLTAEDVDSS